jgi:DNA modification methylase
MDLINGDCLEEMKNIKTNSIDLLFCDLPYGQTSCKWDCLIDLDLFWKEVNRICKDTTPMFFTCSTKFGVSLINSNPKNFRYDLVWVKSAPCGFLNAKKMPMKKHEMVYVFYKKLPLYDLSSHTHKFLNNKNGIKCKEGCYDNDVIRTNDSTYDPPLPTSIVKEELCNYDVNKNTYGGGKEGRIKISKDKRDHETRYDPPLPTSVVKEETCKTNLITEKTQFTKPKTAGENNLYGDSIGGTIGNVHGTNYDPPLPNSILEIKSEKGKHPTQKPIGLIEWCLKYYSKEGDKVLDPTMGSGSTGVACKNMNRQFIGIEQDGDIFKIAQSRII